MDRALLSTLLVAVLVMTSSLTHAGEISEERKDCPLSMTFLELIEKIELDAKWISELELVLKNIGDTVCKLELQSKRISSLELYIKSLEEDCKNCSCDCDPEEPDPEDPLSDFDRIFSDHVIAKYNFEENAEDSSGRGHHGSVFGDIEYVSEGVSGLAASFRGKQKIDVDSFRNFNWGSRFSVSVWFKRTGEWSNYQGIVSSGYYSSGSWELRMGREMSGQHLGGGVNTANSPQTWHYESIQATQNVWHHVTMTYDGAELNYYLDNKLQEGDQTCCRGEILVKDTPVTIGQAGFGQSNEYFYGLIDELTIFSKVLSPDDISTIFNTQNPHICADTSLIAYFPFDESYDDKSCYKRHGKATGAVTISKSSSISGGSAYFKGSGRVDVDLFSGYNWGDKFTVSVWFKRTSTSGYQGIVSNGYYTSGSWEIRMGRENSGRMLGGGVVTKDSSKTWDYVYLVAATNEWHHVAMVYDGSRLTFYLDNVKQKGQDSCCNGEIISRDNPLTIGKAGVGVNAEYFNGYIDELKLLSKALSDSEVSKMYKAFAK